jgi:hypothetical protein
MSVADPQLPFPVPPAVAAAPVSTPSASRPSVVPARPVGPRHAAPPEGLFGEARAPLPRSDGLSRETGRLLAAAFGIAWILCPVVEPLPSVDVHYPLWQLPIELAAVASIIAAVVVLWRGGRNGPRLGVAAGVLMAVMTMLCPLAGHTPVGWWTWAQTGLSLFVLGRSVALIGAVARATASAEVSGR